MQVLPSVLLPQNIGNTYTASLYAGLLSVVTEKSSALVRSAR